MRATTTAWKSTSARSWLLQPMTVEVPRRGRRRGPRRPAPRTSTTPYWPRAGRRLRAQKPRLERNASTEESRSSRTTRTFAWDETMCTTNERQQEHGVATQGQGDRGPLRDGLPREAVDPARERRVQGEDDAGRGQGEEADPEETPEVEARAVQEAAHRPAARWARGRRRGGRRSGRPAAAGRAHPGRGSSGRASRGPRARRGRRAGTPFSSSSRFRKAKPAPRMSGERADGGPSWRSDHCAHQS